MLNVDAAVEGFNQHISAAYEKNYPSKVIKCKSLPFKSGYAWYASVPGFFLIYWKKFKKLNFFHFFKIKIQ